MQDLFAEAGLSSGSVYRYFASKDDVILAIVEQNMQEVIDLIRVTADCQKPRTLADILRGVLQLQLVPET